MADWTRDEDVPLIGRAGATPAVLEVTLSLDTSIYAAGDVLADTQVISDAVRLIGGHAVLESVTVIDEDDQGIAFDLYFLSANVSLGPENSPPNISDADARNILAKVPIAGGDYTDLVGVRIATVGNLRRILKAATGTRNIYVAAITGGLPTHTAAGLKLRLGVLRD